MNYVTIKNGVATPITERKQLYYVSNYEWITHVDLHNPDGIKSTDIDFAINFKDRRPVAINVQITGTRDSNEGLFDQQICCKYIYRSTISANCGIYISASHDFSIIETAKKGIFGINDISFTDVVENIVNPQFDKPINCNILIEDVEGIYKIYSDDKYIGESNNSYVFNIFDSTKLYNHSFEIGPNCKCTDVIIKYKFHK